MQVGSITAAVERSWPHPLPLPGVADRGSTGVLGVVGLQQELRHHEEGGPAQSHAQELLPAGLHQRPSSTVQATLAACAQTPRAPWGSPVPSPSPAHTWDRSFFCHFFNGHLIFITSMLTPLHPPSPISVFPQDCRALGFPTCPSGTPGHLYPWVGHP